MRPLANDRLNWYALSVYQAYILFYLFYTRFHVARRLRGQGCLGFLREVFKMFGFSKVIIATFALVSVTFQFRDANASGTSDSQFQICADMISIVFDPETGEQIIARDLCEFNELLAKGFVPEAPVCAFVFGFVRHPVTMETQEYKNTCELNALVRAGYSELLRHEDAR